MVIGLSREPFLTVAELIAIEVCVGTIVPYLNCLLKTFVDHGGGT